MSGVTQGLAAASGAGAEDARLGDGMFPVCDDRLGLRDSRNCRFFTEPCPLLQDRLSRHLAEVRESARAIAADVEAIVLGGGYGRGEGGIRTDGRGGVPALYNDLDYCVFTRRPGSASLRRWIAAEEARGSAALGIDVEMAVVHPRELLRATDSMMFLDLVSGHHSVFGPPDYVSRLVEASSLGSAGSLPLSEATRLLWNRGSGLYFAARRIERGEDQEFVIRNHAKCMLALGDAFVCLSHRYDSSCLERVRRLENVYHPLLTPEIRELHRQGVEFKLRPAHPDRAWPELEAENRRLAALWSRVFLALERERLGSGFASAEDYVRVRRRLMPERPLWKNLALRIRDRRKLGRALPRITDYPRAVLMRALVALLEPEPEGHLSTHAAELLCGNPSASPAEVAEAYEFWWRRYQ